jgi:hypothetical protein
MDPIKPPKPPGLVEVVALLKVGEEKQPEEVERDKAYEKRREEVRQARERLIQWLKEQGAWSEVGRVGEPNAFRMLFLTCTPRVASLLRTSPQVETVGPADVRFEVLTQ